MSRQYVIGSWNDADQYDYSGEQVGQRNAPSKRIHFNADGTACVSSYADDAPKAKAKRSVRYKIIPQQTRLDNIERMMKDLDAEYAEGAMSAREYAELSLVLEKKHDRAYQLLAKAMGWKDEDEQETPAAYTWTESKAPVGTAYAEKDSIFLTLPVDNSFRRAYTWFQKAKMALKSLKG